MDSWIFQPGFPLVIARADGDAVTLTQQRFTLRRTATPTQRWAIPVRARVHTGDGVGDAFAAARRRLDRRSTCRPTRSSCSTRAARASTASRTRPSGATGCSTRACSSRSNGSRSSTTSGRRCSRAARPRPSCSALAQQAPRRARPRRVARARRACCAAPPASSTATRSLVCEPRSADVLEPAFGRLGWEPAAGDDARTRQLRGIVLDAMGTLVEDPGGDRAGARDRYRLRRRPRRRGRVRRDRRERGRRRDVRRLRRPGATARDTAGAAALSLRARRRSRPRSSCCARSQHAMSDAVRPAERAVRACSARCATASTGRPCGRSCATTGTRCAPGSRDRSCPRMLEGVTWLVDDASSPTCRASSPTHPVPEGARVIAQHLERRQRVRRSLVEPRTGFLVGALVGAEHPTSTPGPDVAPRRYRPIGDGRHRPRPLLGAHPGAGSRPASPRPPPPRSRAGRRSRPATTRCSSRPPARARPSPRSSGRSTGSATPRSRQGQALPRALRLAAARARVRHREEPRARRSPASRSRPNGSASPFDAADGRDAHRRHAGQGAPAARRARRPTS